MSSPVSVSLSGPALSFLLYENIKAPFQQEGFLLGRIVQEETKTITDSDQQKINTSRTIKINSVMPCPLPHYFYTGAGRVDQTKVREFLGDQFKNVVAWYKYQKISSFKFALRDKVLHKQLQRLFNIPSELFTCCLLINEISDNGSTHLYSQAFMRNHNSIYDRVPIHIPNLGDPNNTYRSSEPSSSTFSNIVTNLKIDRKNTPDLIAVNKIQEAVHNHIGTLVEKLSDAEQYLFELEEEIRQLEINRRAKKLHETLRSVNSCRKKLSEEREEKNTESVESSPEPVKKNKISNLIDSSSCESSPEVQKISTPRSRRTAGRNKNAIEVSKDESMRLRDRKK